MCQDFIFYIVRLIFHCVGMLYFMNPFISGGHLTCFHFVAINYACRSICVQVFVRVDVLTVLLSIYLGVGLLGDMVTLYVTFLRTARLFSKVGLHHFYILSGNMRLPSFSTLSSNLLSVLFGLQYNFTFWFFFPLHC